MSQNFFPSRSLILKLVQILLVCAALVIVAGAVFYVVMSQRDAMNRIAVRKRMELFTTASGCDLLIEGSLMPRTFVASDYFFSAKAASLANAAKEGDVERIDELISQGVDVNLRGREGVTPLMYSLTGTSVKGVQRLLERGADPNLQLEVGGDSAVSFAAQRPDSEKLRMLLAHGGNANLRVHVPESTSQHIYVNVYPTPIYNAISGRNAENARMLIKAGANVSEMIDGDTPLMWAAELSSYQVMLELLEAGADFQVKDSIGETVATKIIEHPANPDRLPGYEAMKKCIEFLEKKGVDFEKEKEKVKQSEPRESE